MATRTDYQPGEFCWLDLNAHDLEQSAAWYGKLFGWKHRVMDTPGEGPPYAFLHTDKGTVGGIGQMSDEMKSAGVPPMWNHYVASADCRAAEAKVRDLGGQVTVPTMEVPNHGRLAFFQDPEGAPIAVWESLAKEPTPMLVQEEGAACWNELMMRDMGRAHEFYGGLFGWQFAKMPMGDVDYQMIKSDGKDVGGMMAMDGPQFEGVPAHWMLYFQAVDCAAKARQVEELGGRVMVPPTEVGVGTFAVVSDPYGGMFGLFQMNADAC